MIASHLPHNFKKKQTLYQTGLGMGVFSYKNYLVGTSIGYCNIGANSTHVCQLIMIINIFKK